MDDIYQDIENTKAKLVIAERQAAVADRQVLELTIELRVLERLQKRNSERAGQAPPIAEGTVPQQSAKRTSPIGTSYWPSMIETLAKTKSTFTISDFEDQAKANGYSIKRKSIRSRLVELVKAGTLVRVSDGVFAEGQATIRNTNGSERQPGAV